MIIFDFYMIFFKFLYDLFFLNPTPSKSKPNPLKSDLYIKLFRRSYKLFRFFTKSIQIIPECSQFIPVHFDAQNRLKLSTAHIEPNTNNFRRAATQTTTKKIFSPGKLEKCREIWYIFRIFAENLLLKGLRDGQKIQMGSI